MAWQVKDLALSLLWHGFDPLPVNVHMPWVWPKIFFKFYNISELQKMAQEEERLVPATV